MNIVATNDDGIESKGLISLVEALKKAGHNVVTVAPDRERSGSAHCISFANGIEIKETLSGVWACRGTPADCVVVVTSGVINFRPDLVVSGINAGPNLGTDIVFSGTAAAARQAVLNGVPGMAFSLYGNSHFDYRHGAAWAAGNLNELISLCSDDVFININFPEGKCTAPMTVCRPAARRYADKMRCTDSEDGWKKLRFGDFTIHSENTSGTDYSVVIAGGIAVSRISVEPVEIPMP